jgi:hypothetical protein
MTLAGRCVTLVAISADIRLTRHIAAPSHHCCGFQILWEGVSEIEQGPVITRPTSCKV